MLTAAVRGARRSSARPLALITAVLAAIFMLSFTSLSASAHASTVSSATSTAASMVAAAKPHSASVAATKKAVIVVGPVGSQTAEYIQGAKDIAKVFTDAGMEVHLILPPHSTWAAVTAVATGADFFAYLGHGNGWPSPYPPFQENSKDGLGLDPTDGDTNYNDVKYYGADMLKASITLAPNAIVLLNRLCYADGNGEPGMAIPTQDVAFQRADNFASGFLAIGARVVFALGWQPGADLASALVNDHETMDNFFMWNDGEGTEPQYKPYHGWIGWEPNLYLNSVRTSGATVHLDPDPSAGFLRAVTGDLSFTTDEWWGGDSSGDTTPPTVTDLSAGSANTSPAGSDPTPVFTPNGDGISDTLTITQTLSEPAYLDVSITNADDAVVRDFTTYSAGGTTTDTWDGKNASAAIVPDGTYTITVTPKDRAGNVGDPASTNVKVLTAMKSPKALPLQFYAADGDTLAQTQSQRVTLVQPADLTWVVTNKAGTVVRTAMSAEHHAAGLVKWTWDGKDDSGAYVPDGSYIMAVTATTSQGSYTNVVKLYVSPFKVTSPTLTAKAGKSIKLTILTAEPQKGWPKLTVVQPGLKKYSVALTRYSTTKFTATIKFKKGGQPGTVLITIVGTDSKGGVDSRIYKATVQ